MLSPMVDDVARHVDMLDGEGGGATDLLRAFPRASFPGPSAVVFR